MGKQTIYSTMGYKIRKQRLKATKGERTMTAKIEKLQKELKTIQRLIDEAITQATNNSKDIEDIKTNPVNYDDTNIQKQIKQLQQEKGQLTAKANITQKAHNELAQFTHKNISELWKSINAINKRRIERHQYNRGY